MSCFTASTIDTRRQVIINIFALTVIASLTGSDKRKRGEEGNHLFIQNAVQAVALALNKVQDRLVVFEYEIGHDHAFRRVSRDLALEHVLVEVVVELFVAVVDAQLRIAVQSIKSFFFKVRRKKKLRTVENTDRGGREGRERTKRTCILVRAWETFGQ